MIAISYSDYLKYGCPVCGCEGDDKMEVMCPECGEHFVVLPDGKKESSIGFIVGDDRGMAVAEYPCLQEHPRKGVPWHVIQQVELNDEQLKRNDEIYQAVYGMCKVLTENEDLEYDMYYIGEITEVAVKLLRDRGESVRYPAVVTGPNGIQYVKEYYEP